MSTSYAQFATEHRRLTLLRALRASAQYRAPGPLLRDYCVAVGCTVSSDQLATDLAWLAEQGLLELQRDSGVSVATLTERGLDVANGSAQVPGVQRPLPGA